MFEAPAIAPEILSFSLPDAAGKTVSPSEYIGRPVLVFFFRGFWCAYCVAQLVDLERLKATSLARVPVLAISPDGPGAIRAGLAAVAKDRGVKLTHRFLADADARYAARYGWAEASGPRAVRPPTLVLLDAQGRDVWHAGESHFQARSFEVPLREAIARLHEDAAAP
ncbi:MAG TPA: TlpA disulfide reductase family protein [Thermoanaerobaculia bacterium]|nr:TlpA disulfide reductase family protein [Thermoanaerobaculia bacterium]